MHSAAKMLAAYSEAVAAKSIEISHELLTRAPKCEMFHNLQSKISVIS